MKLLTLDILAEVLHQYRNQGDRIVHCHGCFDVPHVGHAKHLRAAKRLGDILVVTLTCDEFVRKGPGRPVFNEDLRAEALAALQCVDFVSINRAESAAPAIRMIRPHVYAKGPECRTHKTPGLLAEEEAILEVGGTMAYTDDAVFSSTEILGKVLAT